MDEDVEVDDHTGVQIDGGITPMDEEYGDMLVSERPEDDNEEAIDQYLNMELIMDVGTDNERPHGRVIKRLWGQDGEAIR